MLNIIRKIFGESPPKTLYDRVCDKMEKAKKKGHAAVVLTSFDESTIEDNAICYKGTNTTNIIDLLGNNSDSKEKPFDKSAIEKNLTKRIHMLGFIDAITLSRLRYDLKHGGKGIFTPSHVKYYNSEGKEIK